jgi:sulfite reductase (ferredoxin)
MSFSELRRDGTAAASMTEKTWKEQLAGLAPEAWESELDVYETQLVLKKRGRLDDKLFAETRLRRGAYGQRYDNGKRHDGVQQQPLEYPAGDLLKGPETLWDAPGMQRIKIPLGKLTGSQLLVVAELAEEYSDQILHVTTRQDIQLHFVHIEDTPALMRRLASVGITTREACGNSVRNVTACPIAGVCRDEVFDVSPYARALTFYLLGHEAGQNMGRKFKVAFSGCSQHACGLTGFHDIGCIARVRASQGRLERGFAFYVGGGLGPVPQAAELLDPFVPEHELLPLSEAVCRVFARLGERTNRSRARMKFLLKKLGIDEFRRLVLAERAELTADPRWTEFLGRLDETNERPLLCGKQDVPDLNDPRGSYRTWLRTNVYAQRQLGYSAVTIQLPLGDFTPQQARAVVELMGRYTGDTLRTTVEQNLLLRWVRNEDLPELFAELSMAGLGEAGASGLTDVTSCPGTDTCKLGISSSRGLARELRHHLTIATDPPPAARDLHIKCSGCFNSCGQHHVADIGFLGVSRNVNGRRVPHFQLVVGGQWQNNARTFGLAIGAIPSKRVPLAVDRLTAAYASQRGAGETFQAWAHRVGRKEVKALINDLTDVPSFEEQPELYRDWGDPRVYTTGDQGTGECAGEVVSPVQFALADSERLIFEAQVALDEGRPTEAAGKAQSAMLGAAACLTRELQPGLPHDTPGILQEFRRLLAETGAFDAASPGGKFAHYLFRGHDLDISRIAAQRAHELIEEAQLFVDASHQYHTKRQPLAMTQGPSS